MRRNALLAALFSLATVGVVAPSHASTSITYLANPTPWQVTLYGQLHKPSNYSKCADLSAAIKWNNYYWCPSSVGVLDAAKVAALNSSTTTTPTTTTPTTTTTTSTTSTSIAYLLNPTPWQVTLYGQLHKPSNYSKCANLSAAVKWNNYYWCPSSVGVLDAAKVAALNSSTGSTGGSTTPPSDSTTPPPSGSTGGTTTTSIAYLLNPTPWQVTLYGQLHKPSNYSKCANLSAAAKWNNYYWCPSSVGVLDAAKVAALTGSTGGVTTPTPTPTPTAPVTSTYTAKLSWVAPSTREDGTPLSLSELKGYEIHYTSDDLTQGVTLPVSTASTTSYAVSNLKPGTYHFAITAIDSKGLKSRLSTMVSATLGS